MQLQLTLLLLATGTLAVNALPSPGSDRRQTLSKRAGMNVPISQHSIPLGKRETTSRDLDERTASSFTGPLKLIGDYGIVGIDIELGGETFTMMLDTGSSDFWIPAPDFACRDVNFTEISQDDCSTFPTLPKGFTFDGGAIPEAVGSIAYSTGEGMDGPLGYETTTFAGLTVPRVPFTASANVTFFQNKGISGIIGFGWPLDSTAYIDDANQTSLLVRPFIFEAIRQGLIHPIFSLVLDIYAGTDNVGHLTLGGMPEDVAHGEFVTASLLKITDLDNVTQLRAPIPPAPLTHAEQTYPEWMIKVDGYKIVPPHGGESQYFTYDHLKISDHTDSAPNHMRIDTGFWATFLPNDAFNASLKLFDHPVSDYLGDGWSSVDCNAKGPSVAIVVNGVDLWFNQTGGVINGRGYRLSENSTTEYCRLGIQGLENGEYLAGLSWLEGLVTVFDIGNAAMKFAQRDGLVY